jgi:hypothetical protein
MPSKKQQKNHNQRLNQAMKSLYNASTPISSILPVQKNIEVAKTSEKARGTGTRQKSRSTMPQKLLLQITDPGRAPEAPKAVANPGSMASPNFSNAGFRSTPASWNSARGAWDPSHPSYRLESGQMNTAISNYGNYVSALATYNADLTTYNTAVAQRAADTATNTARTSQYQKDLQSFLAAKGKSRTRKSKAPKRASRNPSGGGTRGGKRGSR